jgi:hypothetical protein
MAAQLTRVPEPLYQICPDVPPPFSAIIMQCLAKEPDQRPPTAEALMTALDSITTSSGEIKTAATQVLPAVSQRRRRMTAGAGAGIVLLGFAVAVYASQKSGRPIAGSRVDTIRVAEPAPVSSAANNPATPVPPAAAPLKLTRQDSRAIAEAIQKRIAKEEAVRGRQEVAVIADSIATHVTKAAIDSILRANIPPGMPIPAWTEFARPMAFAGKRRVVVTEPRSVRNANLNAFGSVLADSIRRALMRRKNYSVVDPDSVAAVLSVSRVRSDVEKALKPDMLITPTIVGAGDSMTVMVTVRDTHNFAYGTRVASTRFSINDPEASIPALMKSLLQQIESLANVPAFVRVRTGLEGRGTKNNQ